MQLKTTLFILFSLVLVATAAIAQTDTIPGATRLAQSSGMEAEMDYLLGRKVPARWVWFIGQKVQASTGQPQFDVSNPNNLISAGFSYKIAPAIALGLTVSSKIDEEHWISYPSSSIDVELHQRWYFDMRKRVREGRGSHNFSGQYLELNELVAFFNRAPLRNYEKFYYPRIQLRYGIQHQFRQYTLLDVSMGLSYQFPTPRSGFEFTVLEFTPNFTMATALFRNTRPTIRQQHVRPRFHEQQRMLKLDLLGILRGRWINNIEEGNFTNFTAVSPHVAFEQKWGNLPISTELGTRISWAKFKSNYMEEQDDESAYSLETRWFYNKIQKTAVGKAGNNLSGPFVALHYQYEWRRRNTGISSIQPGRRLLEYHRTYLLWGYQQRFFKRGFAQLKLGAGRVAYHLTAGDRNAKGAYYQLYSEVRVGLAF